MKKYLLLFKNLKYYFQIIVIFVFIELLNYLFHVIHMHQLLIINIYGTLYTIKRNLE